MARPFAGFASTDEPEDPSSAWYYLPGGIVDEDAEAGANAHAAPQGFYGLFSGLERTPSSFLSQYVQQPEAVALSAVQHVLGDDDDDDDHGAGFHEPLPTAWWVGSEPVPAPVAVAPSTVHQTTATSSTPATSVSPSFSHDDADASTPADGDSAVDSQDLGGEHSVTVESVPPSPRSEASGSLADTDVSAPAPTQPSTQPVVMAAVPVSVHSSSVRQQLDREVPKAVDRPRAAPSRPALPPGYAPAVVKPEKPAKTAAPKPVVVAAPPTVRPRVQSSELNVTRPRQSSAASSTRTTTVAAASTPAPSPAPASATVSTQHTASTTAPVTASVVQAVAPASLLSPASVASAGPSSAPRHAPTPSSLSSASAPPSSTAAAATATTAPSSTVASAAAAALRKRKAVKPEVSRPAKPAAPAAPVSVVPPQVQAVPAAPSDVAASKFRHLFTNTRDVVGLFVCLVLRQVLGFVLLALCGALYCCLRVVGWILDVHLVAWKMLRSDGMLIPTLLFLLFFPQLVGIAMPWAPPWVPVLCWYGFLVHFFCLEGSTFSLTVSRVLVTLMFLIEGVSHHSFLLDLLDNERIFLAFVVISFKLQFCSNCLFAVACALQGLWVTLLPSDALWVSWIQLLLACVSWSILRDAQHPPANAELGEDGDDSLGGDADMGIPVPITSSWWSKAFCMSLGNPPLRRVAAIPASFVSSSSGVASSAASIAIAGSALSGSVGPN